MQGTKSLQDLFTDEKVPRSRRPGLPVVTCGDRIIWVCGLRMSEDFRVTSRSEHLIRLTVARRQIEDEVR
jgi:tRNA(Ile)-lysidine synthase